MLSDVVVSHFEAKIRASASTPMSRSFGTSFESDVGSFVAGSLAGLCPYALATFAVHLSVGPVKTGCEVDACDAFVACGGVVFVDLLQGGTVVVRCTACETFARDVIYALARFMSADVEWDSFCVHGLSRLWPARSRPCDAAVLWTAARALAVGPRVRVHDVGQRARRAMSAQPPQTGHGCCWLHDDGAVTLDGFADVDAMIDAALDLTFSLTDPERNSRKLDRE